MKIENKYTRIQNGKTNIIKKNKILDTYLENIAKRQMGNLDRTSSDNIYANDNQFYLNNLLLKLDTPIPNIEKIGKNYLNNNGESINVDGLDINNNGDGSLSIEGTATSSYEETEGTSFTLTDAQANKQASITEIKGNTTQEGTPTPSSPVEVKTVSGDNNIVVSNKNLLSSNFSDYILSTGNYGYIQVTNKDEMLWLSLTDKDTTVDITGVYFGFSATGYNASGGVKWALSNGTISSTGLSNQYTSGYHKYICFYPKNEATFNKIFSRFNVQVEKGNQATTYIEHERNNYNINLGDNSPILPIDYQEVEYIESTGKQSLDTGVIGNYTDNLTIKAKLQLLKTKGSENAIMGNKNSSNQGTTMFFSQNSSNLRTWCGSGTTWNIADLTVNEDTEIEISFTVPSGRNAIINNTSYTSTRANNVTSNDTTFAIFNDKPSTVLSPSFLRVYYYEIYIDNVKKCQLIPCYRKSDNVIGMYDLVTNTFKTHIGTENFIKGKNVYHEPIELNKIGNYQDKLLQSTGKNLFDIGSTLNDWIQTSNNGLTINSYTVGRTTATISGSTLTINSYDNTGYTWISKWLNLEKNTDYIISGTNDNDIKIVGFNSNALNTVGTLIKTKTASQSTQTFNSGNYEYYCLSFYPSAENKKFTNIMINEGTTALPYEPFGIGKWYIEKNIGKVVLNGDSNIVKYDNNGRYYIGGILATKGSTNSPNAMSNYYKGAFALSNGNIFSSGVDGTINMINTSYLNDLAGFKTWLSTHNTTVYYVLATPTYTEITDTYLLNQLNGILDMQLYENLCYVDWVGIEKPTMTLKYNYDTKYNYDLGVQDFTLENGKNYTIETQGIKLILMSDSNKVYEGTGRYIYT